LGLADVYSKRNEIIQDRINQAFPTAFDAKRRPVDLRGSFPEALLRNGIPFLARLIPAQGDSREVQQQKLVQLQGVLSAYSRETPVFSDASWKSMADEIEASMNLSLAALGATNSHEQACATVLMHRSFTQLLSVIGFDKSPLLYDEQSGEGYFPSFEKLLDHKEGSTLRACRQASYFVDGSYRRFLTADDLGNFNTGTDYWPLDKHPASTEFCTPQKALPLESWQYNNQDRPASQGVADSDDWFDLIRSSAHFAAALNPGASWWDSNPARMGYPLIKFDSLHNVAQTGGLLPYQAHALGLAVMNVAVSALDRRHLVYMDRDGSEVKDAEKALLIRLSLKARAKGSHQPAITTLRSALTLVDTVLKLRGSFSVVADWQYRGDAYIAALKADTKVDAEELAFEEIEYAAIKKGLFGGPDNLQNLTTTQPGKARDIMRRVQIASLMLAGQFAKKQPGGGYSCYTQIKTSFNGDGTLASEERLGECKGDDRRLFKEVFGKVAKLYGSPLFAEYARDSVAASSKPRDNP
jgi:hypothetical protein